MTSSLTQQWLRQNIRPYNDSDRIYNDSLSVLVKYPSLRPKTDIYTFNDGRTQLLLSIHGLLPITFKSAQYNIPIAIWSPLDYPRSPPLAYVVPTPDMLIRQSHLVQLDGSLSLPYLDNWRQKFEVPSIPLLFYYSSPTHVHLFRAVHLPL
jgi:ESCRT-I complex subunit TSG101